MKTVLITGTSSGLGEATAKLFQLHGWKVIATMRNVEKAGQLAHLPNVDVIQLDVTDLESIKLAVETATSSGGVDVVINNAAYGAIGPLEAFSDEQILQQINTNLLGVIRLTRAFIPHFRQKKGGLFLNITSMAGLLTFPFASLYHATKFALEGWTEGMYYELKEFGISVKAVAPGGIKSAFVTNTVMQQHFAYRRQMDHFASIITNPAVINTYSEAVEIAEVVYEAATDGKDQVHYLAGSDAKHLYGERMEMGAEIFRKKIETMFLS